MAEPPPQAGTYAQVDTPTQANTCAQADIPTQADTPTQADNHTHVKPMEGLWAFIHGKSCFSGLQSPLGITNGNSSHNKPLELI